MGGHLHARVCLPKELLRPSANISHLKRPNSSRHGRRSEKSTGSFDSGLWWSVVCERIRYRSNILLVRTEYHSILVYQVWRTPGPLFTNECFRSIYWSQYGQEYPKGNQTRLLSTCLQPKSVYFLLLFIRVVPGTCYRSMMHHTIIYERHIQTKCKRRIRWLLYTEYSIRSIWLFHAALRFQTQRRSNNLRWSLQP